MNRLEQAIVEKFNRDGKVAVWMDRDDVSNILSYLFAHSETIYVNGRYTIFKRASRPLFLFHPYFLTGINQVRIFYSRIEFY